MCLKLAVGLGNNMLVRSVSSPACLRGSVGKGVVYMMLGFNEEYYELSV